MRGDNADDPLVQAIGDLREEVDRLISAQRVRLEQQEAQGLRPHASASSLERPAPKVRPRQGRSNDSSGRTAALASSVHPSAASDEETNPRNRLDALARHLDDRLRRRREPGQDRPDSPNGP
jgi:hypothetical protein